ncbi:MAG: YceI family protein [Thermodesulfobacteriota bacterium]
MAKWTFEPGHTAAHFRVRHMMVTWVRGLFGDVHGTLDFDADEPEKGSVEIRIDARKIRTGEDARDAHLRHSDFLDVERYPEITFKGCVSELHGENHFKVTGPLTLHGISKEVTLDCEHQGAWKTPWWVGDTESGYEDKGPVTRAGFTAEARINRFDFGVSWQDTIDRGGVVVGRDLFITIDAEAVLDSDLERIGEK